MAMEMHFPSRVRRFTIMDDAQAGCRVKLSSLLISHDVALLDT